MNRFPHLAQRLFNVPLAITPAKAEIIMAALGQRLGIAGLARADGGVVVLDDDDDRETTQRRVDPGYDLAEGVACIQVHGTLVQRNYCLRPYSGMTGYDGIREAFVNAMEDDAVRAIMFDIDSPGGEVAGCFDLADMIRGARGAGKPIAAILNENACSAAYAIASAADRITVPRTGFAGSIGVISLLVDLSKALTSAGVVVNIIQFGARKADGLEAIPLPKEARDRFQAQVDAMGDLFVATVARNRGLDPAKVRGMEAATFLGADAVTQGLADAVMAPEIAVSELISSLQ